MYTLDASVHLGALNPAEAGSADCQAFLQMVGRGRVPLFNPTLLLVEVAGAVARVFGDEERAVDLVDALHGWSNQTWVALDDTLADVAAHLAAVAGLRGADAVYAAVARQYGTTLVTLDRQQLERLPPLVRTARPLDVLQALGARG